MDTGLGEGRFWRQDASTGNVEDVTHLMANLTTEDQAKLDASKKVWAEEEANLKVPTLSTEQEGHIRRTLAEWENPRAGIAKREFSVIKIGDRTLTRDEYFAIKAEATAEYGEIDESSLLLTRDVDSANFPPMFAVIAAIAWPAVVLAGAAIAVVGAGALAGGIYAAVSHHKKGRKKKAAKAGGGKKKKCKGKHCKDGGDWMEKREALDEGASVWETEMGDVEIVDFNEVVHGPVGVAV